MLALILRLSGITWGLGFDGSVFAPLGDEYYVMNALQSVDFSKGEFTPTAAHLEGTLGFYIWQVVLVAAKAADAVGVYPKQVGQGSPDFAKMVLLGRLTMVLFDVGCVALVYFVLRRMRLSWPFACIGALVLAVMPFEVIYSRYMRPHVLANFFVTLTMFATVKMMQSLRTTWAGLAGFCCGLAGAARYPGVLAAAIPLMALAYEELLERGKFRLGPVAICRATFSRLAAILVGMALGLFLADPMLFLDFRSAMGPILGMLNSADFSQFDPGALTSFRKLWDYLAVLLPWGTAPHLWILLYISFFLALCSVKYRRYVLPFSVFVLMVIFFMGKGYFHKAEFVRTLSLIFPSLAVLTGIGVSFAWGFLRSQWARMSMAAALCFLIGGSVIFDIAYARGMINSIYPDKQFSEYIKNLEKGQPVRVGYVMINWTSILPSPFLDRPEIILTPLYPDTPKEIVLSQDYLFIRNFMLGDEAQNMVFSKPLLDEGHFRVDKKFENDLSFAGISYNGMELPHDMAYPFARIVVLKSTAQRMPQ